MAHTSQQQQQQDSKASHAGPSNLAAGPARAPRPSSLSLALQQRKRSHSSASPLGILHPPSHSPQRIRTSTGPSPCSPENQRGPSQPPSSSQHSPSSSSSTRFVTSSSDFHLPQRAVTPTPSSHAIPFAPTLMSPNAQVALAAGVTGEEATQQVSSVTSLPLLRRKAAAAALAHASGASMRRGSMLGKEVAKDGGEQTSGEEDEEMEEDDQVTNGNECSPLLDNEDQDDDMQIATGDVTMAGVELESKPTRSHSPSRGGTTAVRRAVQRRANLLPRDRGVLRVAASLRDETRPADGEIASEAKLQRRLGPESDSLAPTTPKLLARRSQSPFGPSSAGPSDRGMDGEDFSFPDGSHFDLSDGSDSNGEEEIIQVKYGHVPLENDNNAGGTERGIAIPGVAKATHKEKLWLGFRESSNSATGGNPRLSPGTERTMARSRGPSLAPTGSNATTPLSASLGAALDQAMELEPYHHSGSSPSLWGKSAKRKMGDDRFEPYFSHALYKRRAVSPIALVSANVNSVNGRRRSATPTSTLSPGLSGINQMSPLNIQAHPHSSASAVSNLPTPTPLSIPSPTLSFSRPSGLSGSFPRSIPSLPPNRLSASTNPSPASTRPSTPTNQLISSLHAAGPSPSLINASANKSATAAGGSGANGGGAGTAGGGNGQGGNGGSGPGYGSGALGLSLGGGSKRYKEEQEEKEEEEGMLGDVSAIQLGEL